jgi:hypothetical protein
MLAIAVRLARALDGPRPSAAMASELRLIVSATAVSTDPDGDPDQVDGLRARRFQRRLDTVLAAVDRSQRNGGDWAG